MDRNEIKNRNQSLVEVAMGREPADLVIKNGRWVCVQSGEIIPGTDISIKGQRIAYVGPDAPHTIAGKTQVIDAEDCYLVPGLLDGHMHVESGMVTVTEFVRAVAPRGTTGMFIDPHEIANVFGLKGVKLMADEAAIQPIHVWVQVPSCVPSAPGLETPGASINPDDVIEALTWDRIIGLGEVMNFPGVFLSDERMHAEIAAAIEARKTVGGHYASPDLGLPFHGYAAGGPQDDHEGTRLEDAIARVRQGMKPMLRYGSGWLDVETQVKAITENGIDPRHFILCTDDSHAETLVENGHMDRALRHTISQGVNPITAIQMATLNTAEHFGLADEIGQIAPRRYADILLVKDLEDFKAGWVISKGQVIARDGVLQVDLPSYPYPGWATDSVKLARPLDAGDFKVPVETSKSVVKANVIGVVENQAPTKHLQEQLGIKNNEVQADLEKDILKIALIERHKRTGRVIVGFVHGFGFTGKCAIGTTVAHDSHHMIVVGTEEEQMALAANHLSQLGGGQVVIKDNEVIAEIPLPIAGLMSNQPANIVAQQASKILEGFRVCGCSLNNPNMQLSLLALVVIPELRISDLGLVDVTKFEFIQVLEG